MASGSVTAPRPLPADADGHEPASARRRAALLIPGAVVLVTAMVIGLFDGGYNETVWYPIALFLLALLVLVVVVAPPARTERSRWFDIAVVALGAFTLWTFLSVLWADTPSDAWEAANRTLLYWIGFTLVGLRPWPPWAARAALIAVSLGVGAAAVGMLLDTALRDDASTLFLEGRLSEPFGYANATANFWMIAYFPAVHLAIARDSPWPVRGLFLGLAVLLIETAVVSQSRGAVLAFGIAATAFVLLHPRHWSALAAVAVSVGLVALGWDQLIDVRNAGSLAELDSELGDARSVIVLSTLVAFVAGTAAAFADRLVRRRVPPSAARARLAERGFLAAAAGVALAGLVVLSMSGGWIDDRWDDFRTSSYRDVEARDTRLLGSLGSGRYDFYRVSLNAFREDPLTGLGADNFGGRYLRDRRVGEAPRYPHSLAFSLVGTLGAVGVLLFGAFLAAAVVAFARVRWRGGLAERGLAVGALGGFGMWFAHAQVDWLWEYPALTLLGLGLLAVALPVHDASGLPGPAGTSRLVRSLGVRAAVAVLIVFCAFSLALAGAAARYERSAYSVLASDPEAAIARLQRAADLDRLTADPLIGRAVVLRDRGRVPEAREALTEALDREPENWFGHFELALLDAGERRWALAQRSIRRAAELNPRQPLVDHVQELIATRQTVEPAQIDRQLRGQLSGRLVPFGAD